MKLRCKPGDQAIIISAHRDFTKYLGRECSVLYLVPAGPFYLPDGIRHCEVEDVGRMWCIKMKELSPIYATSGVAGKLIKLQTYFAVTRDDGLLPIRPEPDPLAITREAKA